MPPKYYILIDGQPVPVDFATFLAWTMEQGEDWQRVKLTEIGGVEISTRPPLMSR